MKNKIALAASSLTIAVIAAAACSVFPAFAHMPDASALSHTDTTPYNWYIRRNAEHRIPAMDPRLSFINEYGAFYVDENASDDDKVVYLTFDAGYENGNIAKTLDVLKKHNAKAAFFVLSHLIKKETELVKRMAEEGHLVCNHTCSHRDMTKINDYNVFAEELESLCALMKDKTGCEIAKYYRPPEGRFSETNLKFANDAGYKTVFWSFAYADWDNNKQPDSSAAIDKIMSNIHNGEIMLLHPTSATNAAILDQIMTSLEEEGYRFGSLDEIENEKNC